VTTSESSELVATGLSSLSALDAVLWRKTIARRLRNPDSLLRSHVPRDGVVAATLDLVGRLWFLLAWIIVPGIVLVDLSVNAAVTDLGWICIIVGVGCFAVGTVATTRAVRARRAWRREQSGPAVSD